MANWDYSPTARHRSFTPVSLLGHYLEAEVGIGPFRRGFRAKITQLARLLKYLT